MRGCRRTALAESNWLSLRMAKQHDQEELPARLQEESGKLHCSPTQTTLGTSMAVLRAEEAAILAELGELHRNSGADSGAPPAEPSAAATEAEIATLDPELCLAQPHELPMIAEMKQIVAAELAFSVSSSEAPDVTGDLRFLRFLRSRSHDVPLAAEAMRSMLLWRRANSIDETIRPRCVGRPLAETSLPHADKVTKVGMKGAINAGISRDGHVITISLDGAGDPTTLLRQTSEEELSEFFRCYFELRMIVMDAETRKRRTVVRTLQLRDLEGAGMVCPIHVHDCPSTALHRLSLVVLPALCLAIAAPAEARLGRERFQTNSVRCTRQLSRVNALCLLLEHTLGVHRNLGNH